MEMNKTGTCTCGFLALIFILFGFGLIQLQFKGYADRMGTFDTLNRSSYNLANKDVFKNSISRNRKNINVLVQAVHQINGRSKKHENRIHYGKDW